jgi:hypothetical protein
VCCGSFLNFFRERALSGAEAPLSKPVCSAAASHSRLKPRLSRLLLHRFLLRKRSRS